jgi:hypothetical protein
MINAGIFCDHWKYVMAIWSNLWPFGIACGYIFPRFGMFGPRKIWQPCLYVGSFNCFFPGSLFSPLQNQFPTFSTK